MFESKKGDFQNCIALPDSRKDPLALFAKCRLVAQYAHAFTIILNMFVTYDIFAWNFNAKYY